MRSRIFIIVLLLLITGIFINHTGNKLSLSQQVVAEQNFDAWCRYRNINTWQYEPQGYAPPALFNERGYTGHEHLPAHYLINMNGRMYDPIMGRMLSPDNYVPDPWHTQGYNRYSYANNNPFKFTDPDGNILWFVVGAAALINGFASGVAADIQGRNFLGGFFRGAISGAIVGAGATSFAGAMLGLAGSAISSQIPGININIGSHLTISISPAIVFGSSVGVGVNIGASLHGDYGSIGFSYGLTAYAHHAPTGKSFVERRFGYGVNLGGRDFNVGLGTMNFKGGGIDQTTGYASLGGRNWSVMYENDGVPFSPSKGELGNADGGDSYRTMAATIRVGEFSLGTQLFTGRREYGNNTEPMPGYPHGMVKNSEINQYKFAALFAGYGNYRVGWNHYMIGQKLQNEIAHHAIIKQPWIPWRSNAPYYPNKYYGGYFRANPFTNW